MAKNDTVTGKSGWVALAGVAALLGMIGGGVAMVVLILLPFILIVTHDWPWFHPAPALILPEPNGHTTLFYVSLVLLALSFGIRLTRRISRGLSVFKVVMTVLIGTVGWYIHAHTGLGAATIFIFRWVIDLGAIAGIIYAVGSFLGGLAPGFLGAQGILLYLVYHDPRLIAYSLLPAVIGEVFDSLVGDIRESDEKSVSVPPAAPPGDSGVA